MVWALLQWHIKLCQLVTQIYRSLNILDGVFKCSTEDDYEELLKALADTAFTDEYLIPYSTQSKESTIYECKGYFEYVIHYDDEDEEEEEYEDEE